MTGHSGPLPERFLTVDDEKNTSHDDKHPAGKGSRIRPDQVLNRTDPVTSWLSQTEPTGLTGVGRDPADT